MDLDLHVKQIIKKTASELDVSESTAAILLVKYEWNAAQLCSDHSILKHYATESSTPQIHTQCSIFFQQVKQIIKTIASELDVSESTAAILLVKYEWNAAQLRSDHSILKHCATESSTPQIHTQCSIFFQQVKQIIKKTASELDVSESIAAILLVKYEWNAAQLCSDHSIFKHCATESSTPQIHTQCFLCSIFLPCSFIGCGHCFCVDCLRASVEQQLASNKLILSCPSQACHKYLNFNMLPQDLLELHLSALEIDLAKKTSLRGQCLSYLCNHKYALATTFCSLGYAVISVGSEVKSKVTSLKKFVASGSKTVA
ncbi:hypothetical protein IGI04_026771, partial [Brassica rapa subsp. trilocularis]